MNRRILPLAAIASILALLAGLYASDSTRAGRQGTVAESAPPEADEGHAASALPCGIPLGWRIARLDNGFGLARGEARAAIERAARLWEVAVGQRIFVHDEEARLLIAFVYDGRQAASTQKRRLHEELDRRSDSLEAEGAALSERQSRLVRDRSEYRRRIEDFEGRAASHNASVREWNRRNPPADVVERLGAIGERLRLERIDLAEQGRDLETAGLLFSDDIDRLNATLADHGRAFDAMERASPAQSVRAGQFVEAVDIRNGRLVSSQREIHVFQFDDATHLDLVLAHELGHSLGLGHAPDPDALMSEELEHAGGGRSVTGIHPGDLALLRARCPGL